jgi:predicted GIY-YIG superfamily endonuclease
MQYYVYILASQRNGTLYIGVTNTLVRRTWQHRDVVYKRKANQEVASRLEAAVDRREQS